MRLLTPHECKALIESDPDIRLIDCREADEYAICKINEAELIPLSNFPNEYSIKLPDKKATLLIYCHHGMRSQRAAEYLTQLGYTDVIILQGGIEAWSVEIDSSVPRY